MTYNPISLTENEREHLLYIYRTRLRLFVGAFSAILFLAVMCCMRIDTKDRYTGKVTKWTPKSADYIFTSREQAYAFNIFFLVTPLVFFGVRIFKRRIFCLKKDAENGIKHAIPYTIMRKTFFSTTGQYFISFDDPNYMHHEVEQDFYNNCYEGSVAYLYRAPLSKYTFNRNGSFSLM